VSDIAWHYVAVSGQPKASGEYLISFYDTEWPDAERVAAFGLFQGGGWAERDVENPTDITDRVYAYADAIQPALPVEEPK
jgi:hypothetical protein